MSGSIIVQFIGYGIALIMFGQFPVFLTALIRIPGPTTDRQAKALIASFVFAMLGFCVAVMTSWAAGVGHD